MFGMLFIYAMHTYFPIQVIHAYFKAALQHFGTAYRKRNCMVEEWGKHLEKSIKECLDDIRTWIAPRSDEGTRVL